LETIRISEGSDGEMKERISSIYQDGRYLRNNPTWHVEDSEEKVGWILRIIDCHRIQPSTICEVGCGAGEILNQLSQQLKGQITFYGYEVSPQAFELCQSRQKENLHFYHKDVLEEDVFFDLVLVIDVLEHVEDYLGFLRKLRHKGRYKILRIPLDISIQSVIFKSAYILKARNAFGHLHYFTKETALATLKDSGYRIIDIFYTYGPFSLQHLGLRRYLPKLLKKILFSLHKEWMARLLDGFSLVILAE
jgi:2-polyprenyl-3-methyl-5-hydroxy-6-metoxy-1,4-benzoquinol methylase